MTAGILKLNQAAAQIHGVRQQLLATKQFIQAVLAGTACDPVRVEFQAIDNLLDNIFEDVETVADLLAGERGEGAAAPENN